MSCACVSTCGCCAGLRRLTPEPIANRPGLRALAWRAGTQGTFFESMQARLSSAEFPGLRGLRTRARSDFSIALLDAWAVLLDVLTFYDERLANEGFLRTAAERRSVLELARLVGYRVRPGVAAGVYLAFEMEPDSALTLPAGSAAQSQPGPGELPQSFETSEPLMARGAWNTLAVRRSRPQVITRDNVLTLDALWLRGTATGLKAADLLVFDFGLGAAPGGRHTLREVARLEPDNDAARTRVVLRPVAQASLALLPKLALALAKLSLFEASIPSGQPGTSMREHVATARRSLEALATQLRLALPFTLLGALAHTTGDVLRDLNEVTALLTPLPAELQAFSGAASPPSLTFPITTNLAGLFTPLLAAPGMHPANARRLGRDLHALTQPSAALLPQLLLSFQPQLAPTLYASYAAASVTTAPAPLLAVHVLRVRAPLFGYNAPTKLRVANGEVEPTQKDWLQEHESPQVVHLDASYDGIAAGSLALVESAAGARVVRGVTSVRVAPRTAYSLSMKSTALVLDGDSGLWASTPGTSTEIAPLRSAQVWAQSEALELADEPLNAALTGLEIELAQLYDGLEPGRWLAVSGPREDIAGTSGARGAELVMIAGVEHKADASLPGDRPHTTLTLADTGLAYHYRRSAVVVRGNVVKATHGATQTETLGAGDGTRRHQRFMLKKPPLTHVAAATAAGAATTLALRIDDLLWHETETVALAGPDARVFETRLDDDGVTSVIFGDGVGGARLPTGIENVKAVYRSGIGRGGNVKAETVTLLQSRPLGLKGVLNPLPATGGADAETRDQARRNAPLAVMALDRLVSLQDYADFARTFAGIAKASARRLSDGRRQVVHLTIAASADLELNERSELWQALRAALRALGDAHVPVVLALRESLRVTLAARVRLHPDHAWEYVEPRLRGALVEAFGFEARDLGQPLHLSELLAVAHEVVGVQAVDVDTLQALSAGDVLALLEPRPQQTATSAGPFGAAHDGARLMSAAPRGVPVRLARRRGPDDPEGAAPILPAQLAVLDPAVADTVILTEMPR